MGPRDKQQLLNRKKNKNGFDKNKNGRKKTHSNK